ncbi:MAG: D-alanyl-D-alanine carboxypeptidase, partial [Defluviitaleaceae bacterium]|nr:D-alanyl-D-alanine carboxypeptidase [Defluviitaleaceae bacterium]
STNALLMDFHSGDVLYSQNGTEKIFPASLVKMMTALVALENIRDLNEEVFLHEKIFAPIHNANATTAGFPPNDSVRAMDLLYGLLLPSGAECAIGLAVHVAGSEKNFVEKMNARAKEIGMNATNFANTTGLHDDAQVSTAMDMAILLRHALENEMFYRIVSAPRHSTAGTRLRPDGITVQSTLFSRMNGAEFSDGKILGGRTGFTNQSGQNLASFAEIKGSKYILVTSGAQTNGNHLTQTLHIDDAFLVYNAVNLASR